MSQPDQKTLRCAAQRLICGESLEAVSRDLGGPAHRLSEWRDRFLATAEGALKTRKSSPENGEIDCVKWSLEIRTWLTVSHLLSPI